MSRFQDAAKTLLDARRSAAAAFGCYDDVLRSPGETSLSQTFTTGSPSGRSRKAPPRSCRHRPAYGAQSLLCVCRVVGREVRPALRSDVNPAHWLSTDKHFGREQAHLKTLRSELRRSATSTSASSGPARDSLDDSRRLLRPPAAQSTASSPRSGGGTRCVCEETRTGSSQPRHKRFAEECLLRSA